MSSPKKPFRKAAQPAFPPPGNALNRIDACEIEEKAARVCSFMDNSGYDAVVIGRSDNFAWFTCGGNNRVVRNWEKGFAFLVVTREDVKLVAQTMDGPRVLDDELHGFPVDSIYLRWYEPSIEEKIAQILQGKKVLSDSPLPGIPAQVRPIHDLHYPLTEKEIARQSWIGKRSEAIIRKVADCVKPGDREIEIAHRLEAEYALQGFECDVLLVGADERIFKYRHPTPSEFRLKKWLLLHPAVQKWGIHANITRHVSFGNPSEDIQRRYEAACQIHATALSLCSPGTRFCDILEAEKQAYAETGFAQEWHNHFQGGITGYLLANPTLCFNPENTVREGMTFDWFITLTGVKSEELSVEGPQGGRVLSLGGHWPKKTYTIQNKKAEFPRILIR